MYCMDGGFGLDTVAFIDVRAVEVVTQDFFSWTSLSDVTVVVRRSAPVVCLRW